MNRAPVIWLNGSYSKDPFLLDTSNRAFRYGDGLFETIKVVFQQTPFFHQNYVRLVEGMDFLKIDIPDNWSVPYLQEAIAGLIKRNNLLHARVRLTVWRDGAGWYTPESSQPAVLLEAWQMDQPFFQLNTEGKNVGFFTGMAKELGPVSSFKSANALPYILAGIEAKGQTWDDAILLNREGRVADAIYSNIFLWKGGVLYTPEEGEGCVNGVMRRVLLKYARKWGIPVEESRLYVHDLKVAEEVFFTNTLEGIQWVAQLEEVQYQNKMAAGLLARLNELLPLS